MSPDQGAEQPHPPVQDDGSGSEHSASEEDDHIREIKKAVREVSHGVNPQCS
jgi:hypothetical protein